MNKIYRLKFDRRRNELVVVSEIAAGTGKEKTRVILQACVMFPPSENWWAP